MKYPKRNRGVIMKRKVVSLSVLLMLVTLFSLFIVSCGGSTSTTNKKVTSVNTGGEKKLQITDVQLIPDTSASASSGKVYAVFFKITNPYKDVYSYNTTVKVNLYGANGNVVGTSGNGGFIANVFPGTRWEFLSGLICAADPVKVETEPTTESWEKIIPSHVPTATITQATPAGSSTIVGSLKYEHSGTWQATQINVLAVVLDANGKVVNRGLAFINNPKIGDNPFSLSFNEAGGISGKIEYSFDIR